MSPTKEFVPRVLSIAGTDPSGGAGLHADLKSIAAAGGYGMGVVTALVAQNTQGVRSVHTPDVSFLKEQLAVVTEDVEIDAVKIGMLGSREIVDVVTEWVRENRPRNIVLDPVMIATSGDRLLDDDAVDALVTLVSEVDVITPNVPELALLAGAEPAGDYEELIEQALDFAAKNNVIVIAKTGHLSGDEAGNAVVFPDGRSSFSTSRRIDTKNTHGTGCSLSSALATRIGAGFAVEEALSWTTKWLNESILFADDLHVGHGHGPIDHGHRARRLEKAATIRPGHIAKRFSDCDDTASVSPQAAASPATTATPRADSPAAGAKAPELRSFFGKPLSIAPVGPHTTALWNLIGDIVEEIDALPAFSYFGEGTLNPEDTNLLLEQEIWYLHNIFPAISMLSIKATLPQDQILWSSLAQESLIRCLELNSDSLSYSYSELEDIEPTGPSLALLDAHASATAFNSYAVSAATLVAELWIVAELISNAPEVKEVGSAAEAWVESYSDESFLDTALLAVEALERALADAPRAEQLKSRAVFRRAAEHERDYFAQLDRTW
nr:bifunctional hydroxymethylpyrimidine kinase/phosphomethylpyrimidine kinase [Corynebacterium lactis]